MCEAQGMNISFDEAKELLANYKRCSECMVVKANEEFYLVNKKKGYREAKCKPCKNKMRTKYKITPPKNKPPKKERVSWFDKLPAEKQAILREKYNNVSLLNLSRESGIPLHQIRYRHGKGDLFFILTERWQQKKIVTSNKQPKINSNDLDWDRCHGCDRNELSCRCGWTPIMAGYEDNIPSSFLMYERG